MAGLCDAGPATIPQEVFSLTDFVSKCGDRVSYSSLYDCVDAYFREGGNSAFIARVVGPAPVIATKNLNTATATVSLIVSALGPGTYGNNIQVAVLAGLSSGYRLQVTYNSVIVETSPDLTTQQDAVAWANGNSDYITVAIGAGTGPPQVAAAAALANGADDRTNITDAQWLTALNLFTKDLGPGQVLAPGRTSDPGHLQLTAHAQANGRVALLDLPDSATKATLLASTSPATGGNGQYGAAFAPWVVIPGVVANTTRIVPPSAVMAGVIARNDAATNPNTPAAGDRGQLQFAVGLSQVPWDDTTRQDLNTGGVNVIRSMFDGFRNYGYRSLANPVSNAAWLDFSNVRYLMWLAARCYNVGESFVFDVIDGQGQTISAYAGSLAALCLADYNAGIIYGATSGEAFNVDVGPAVNTPATIADNQLRAVVAVKPSPFAELVSILIVNVPITGKVS